MRSFGRRSITRRETTAVGVIPTSRPRMGDARIVLTVLAVGVSVEVVAPLAPLAAATRRTARVRRLKMALRLDRTMDSWTTRTITCVKTRPRPVMPLTMPGTETPPIKTASSCAVRPEESMWKTSLSAAMAEPRTSISESASIPMVLKPRPFLRIWATTSSAESLALDSTNRATAVTKTVIIQSLMRLSGP